MEIQINLPLVDKIMLINQIKEYLHIMPSFKDITLEAPFDGNFALGRTDGTTVNSRCKCDFFGSMELRFNLVIRNNGELFLVIASKELRNLLHQTFTGLTKE